MSTETLTLADFLLARIAEDEAVALGGEREPLRFGVDWVDASRTLGERVLAECEAKRRIVEASRSYHQSNEDPDPDDPDGGWALSIALHALALPYADHESFREEWRA